MIKSDNLSLKGQIDNKDFPQNDWMIERFAISN